jgi:predicted ATPase/class 3 adenylate cyclase
MVSELEALLVEHPARERVASRLMLAYYRCGRQGESLEVYQRTRAHLAEELGLEPGPALAALQAQILEQAPTLLLSEVSVSPAVSQAGALPLPATPTVGREREVEELRGLLADPAVRLATLTGPGGVGKTRLAVAAAHQAAAAFEDGACWVELAGVTRADDVGPTIVQALGATPAAGETPRERLIRYLSGKRLLLVVDNFEHVIDAAELLGELVSGCERLKLLVTSREALRLTAELRFVVEPLSVPEVPKRAKPAEVQRAGATALFIAAAGRQDRHFSVSADNAPAVARVCSRLDGLPLAIELAVGRMPVFGVEELAERLERELDVLGEGPRDAPARQQTLRATIEWSYGLLETAPANVFVRFAVFAGGATRDAAQAITNASVETLEALVAKSLIAGRAQPDGTTRLVMLETVRQYALPRLADDTEHDAILRAHNKYYSEFVERAVPSLSTNDEREALAAIDSEIDNIRAALEWALEAAPGDALRLAGQLARYWDNRGDLSGLQWLQRAIAAAGECAPVTDLARAQLMRAWQFVWRLHQPPAAREAALAALDLYHRVDDHAGISEAYVVLSYLGRDERDAGPHVQEASEIHDYAEAACRHARLAGDDALLGQALLRLAYAVSPDDRAATLQQGAELLSQAGNYRDVALGYSNAAWVALKQGRTAEAATLLDVALPMAEQANAPQITMLTLGNIGWANLFAGKRKAARAAFGRQLQLCLDHALGDRAGEGLAGLAATAAGDEQLDTAARLLGAARALGFPPPDARPIDYRLERDYFAPARARYGPDSWRREEQAGATLSYEQAIAEALTDSAPSLSLSSTLAQRAQSDDEARPQRVRRAFMFTDIVDSTPLVSVLGDDAWLHLLQWHDRTLRELFGVHRGEEVDHAGDGFFVAFERADGALRCAAEIQQTLERHRRENGFAPKVRIGIHVDDADYLAGDYHGHGVHVAARIGAQAQAGEVLISRESLEAVSPGVKVGEPRTTQLKGVSRAVELVPAIWT